MPIDDRFCLEVGYWLLPCLVRDLGHLLGAPMSIILAIIILTRVGGEIFMFDFQREGLFLPPHPVCWYIATCLMATSAMERSMILVLSILLLLFAECPGLSWHPSSSVLARYVDSTIVIVASGPVQMCVGYFLAFLDHVDSLGRALIGPMPLLAAINTSLSSQPFLLLVSKGFLLVLLVLGSLDLIDLHWIPIGLLVVLVFLRVWLLYPGGQFGFVESVVNLDSKLDQLG